MVTALSLLSSHVLITIVKPSRDIEIAFAANRTPESFGISIAFRLTIISGFTSYGF